ncbi:MAG TPA: helix-turn-helix domain-containing protein [Usitatibacter sp.]|nr:helix-turn-helix domain-containing protein [Usitatibacter sp.]
MDATLREATPLPRTDPVARPRRTRSLPAGLERPQGCAGCKIRELCLPCGMPGPERAALDGLVYTRKRVKRGEALYRVGGEFESIYAIRSGFFKTRVVLEDGRDQVTGFPMAGQLLGMDGIASGTHTADAIALEDSDVCVIPYARVQDAGLQRQLDKAMSRELVHDHSMMLLLGNMRGEERAAAFLLELSRELVRRGYSAREFNLRMTRDDIGSYLGLSLETVSRLFSRFHEGRIIDVCQRHVRIVDISTLESLVAGGTPQ